MRLKTFFFPITVVISLVIVITYIWPDISRIKDINETKIAKNKELEEIKTKKDAIDSIGNQISSNESDKIVKDYLPEFKAEERIVSSVNYLADSANVSLVDVALEGSATGSSLSGNSSNTSLTSLNSTAVAEKQIGEVAPGASSPATTNQKSDKKSIPVKISISGEYEKIKVFLNGLQHMPIFNVVRSVDISKQKEEKVEGVAVSSGNLLADISVDFGYMPVAKVGITDAQSIKSSDVSNATVEVLKKYISQKAQSLEVTGEEKGKTNPFLAN
ncbi:MAG: hypothetical protein ACD_9C00051G0013 [uncultured bacterium]|nr:MAG: hypothetical protein ACD_9C00051G0013 [uncultured bacterium]